MFFVNYTQYHAISMPHILKIILKTIEKFLILINSKLPEAISVREYFVISRSMKAVNHQYNLRPTQARTRKCSEAFKKAFKECLVLGH